MFNTIICPTNFSSHALNAIDYSARLCQMLNTELLLLNIERSYPLELFMNDGTFDDKIESANEALKKTSEAIKKLFGINCSYEVVKSNRALSKLIDEKSSGEHAIVIGTGWINTFYEHLFGGKAYHVAQHAHCPVFIIPMATDYKTIGKILLTGDFNLDDKVTPKLIDEFNKYWTPSYLLLQFGSEEEASMTNLFQDSTGSSTETAFACKYSKAYEKTAEVLLQASEWKADLIIISYSASRACDGETWESTLKSLCQKSQIPILVIHQD
jgi:nucleotide-binding universal stress UspA family protein